MFVPQSHLTLFNVCIVLIFHFIDEPVYLTYYLLMDTQVDSSFLPLQTVLH